MLKKQKSELDEALKAQAVKLNGTIQVCKKKIS
jgi:hypothetical protein